MGIFITVTAVVGILFSITYFSTRGSQSRVLLKDNIPENLGLLDDVPASKVLERLDKALPFEYINQVKSRFLSDHPNVSDDEFEWRLFELKRYFLLNSIMKTTPMFSTKVDEIWHEMLMFTRQYEAFSEKYLGQMLHHSPNLEQEPAPQERAFFDWVFAQLFEITEHTWTTWGSFFQYPLDQTVLRDVKVLSDNELKQRYFNVNKESEELVYYLIRQLKMQVLESEEMNSSGTKGKFSRPVN